MAPTATSTVSPPTVFPTAAASVSPSIAPSASPTASPSGNPSEAVCNETFYLIGYTSGVERAATRGGAYYVEWYSDSAWSPRQLWFSGVAELGSVVGESSPFQGTSIPEKVRISVEDEDTDDWGYWKLAFKMEGCDEQVVVEEPAESEGPPRTFGSFGVANWEDSGHHAQATHSRNLPDDPFLDWHNWWIGEHAHFNNTYNICEYPLGSLIDVCLCTGSS